MRTRTQTTRREVRSRSTMLLGDLYSHEPIRKQSVNHDLIQNSGVIHFGHERRNGLCGARVI